MPSTRQRAGDAETPTETAATTDAAPTADARPDTTAAKASSEAPVPSIPAGPDSDPASVALDEAVRKAEIKQLTEERNELRAKIGDAPDLVVLRAEVDALRSVAARAGLSLGRQRMSAGVAADLETSGYAVDPANGDVYVRDGDTVTVTSRGGDKRTLDMPLPSTRRPRAEAEGD